MPPSDQTLVQAARLAKLYEGNRRSRGRYDPRKGRMFTEYEAPDQVCWEAHVRGDLGVGVVPICDDDACLWAAIDVDNHGEGEDLPINEVDERIAEKKLPLIACRSKSGGIHAYAFFREPQGAAKVRALMASWSGAIGYGGSEIFPKQGKLSHGKDGTRALGNWLNMPYFGDTGNRYAVRAGQRLALNEFLDLAERSRITDGDIRALAKADHPEAPPCVQRMYAAGVAQGHRNEAIYNITVYHKKAFPNEYEQKSIEANLAVFTKPLARPELLRTIASAGRKDCQYRCNEEPIRSLCDREICLTRKYGILPADAARLDAVDALPLFSDLVKYPAEPVRWEFKIDGARIAGISTAQLLDFREIRQIIAERLTKVAPLIKAQEWERILQPMMSTARVAEVPDDASVSGVIRARLREFCAKSDFSNKGEDLADRKGILRGLPVVQKVGGERVVCFRGEDFISFLKRTKSEELKGVNLWMAIKDMGIRNERLRIPGARAGESNIHVWTLPVKDVDGPGPESPDFKSEL